MPRTKMTPKVQPPHRWNWLVLLLVLLTGCASGPSLGKACGGPQATEVDFECPTPQQSEALRQRGVQLPQASSKLADPREHRDFIERRITAVGFGLSAGGYVLYGEGLSLPVLVPESHVDLGLTHAEPLNDSIFPGREAALAALAAQAPHAGLPRYAYYWGAGAALIVPTVFSPASTPGLARTMLEVRKELTDTVQRDLKVLLLNLSATRVLQGVFSRVVRMSAAPASRPSPLEEGATGQPSAPRQLQQRPAVPAPAPTAPVPTPTVSTLAPASTPARSATPPTTSAPVPAPGALAPSPELVQALLGKNPTPQMAPGTRLPQDIAVNPKVPKQLSTNRSIGPSATQNAQVQADLEFLRQMGATNFRINQQQLTLNELTHVGLNRPDLQFDFRGRRYHVEYDTPNSGRGPRHQARSTSNDPASEVILIILP